MRIVHVIHRYPPAVGGSETWCREICQRLASSGAEVNVLTLDVLEEEEFWKDPSVRKSTMRLGRIDWDGLVFVRRYKRSLPVHTLYHLFFKIVLDRALNIYFYGPHSIEMYGRVFSEVSSSDVVHLHTIPYPHNFIGYLAGRLLRKRVVITPHFHPDHPYYDRWSNYWLLRHCDTVIAVSDYERDYLITKGVDAAKIIVTGNGVHLGDYMPHDLTRFEAELRARHGFSASTKIILFIGRKLEYKGIATLADAVRRLPRELDAVVLLAGPSSSWFEGFYSNLAAEDRERIVDLGTVSAQDKINLLHLADVLVLPSRFEAFGIVFLEAWACGTPVIGAAIGPIPEIIGQDGLTFEAGDAFDLAEKVEILLKDGRLAKEMGRRGREKVLKKYTWEKIGAAVRKAYRPMQDRRMRILMCSNLFPPHFLGGAEVVAYRYAKLLKALGHDVRIFCGRLDTDNIDPYQSTVEEGDFHKTWMSLSQRDLNGDLWDFHNPEITSAFSKILEDCPPDIVHFHNLVGLSVKMIDECRKRGIPTVMTLHDYWGICFKNTMLKNDGSVCLKGGFDCLGCKGSLRGEPQIPSPIRNSHILTSLQKVDWFVAPSHYLAERYAANGLPRERISVLRYGIDLEQFPANAQVDDVLTLGFIGYLGKHKGLDFLLRALTCIDGFERLRLLVVGDGEDMEHLNALCHDLHLDRVVTFYGRIDPQRVGDLYAQIDILAVPSIWPENSPVVIYEAMASGIPVVAFDMGGVRELVEDGVTGFLVPGRDIQALADRIGRLVAQPGLRQKMGERARAAIQRYSLRDQVERMLEIYQEVSERPRTDSTLALDVLLYYSDQPWNHYIQEVFHQLGEVEKRLKRRLLMCNEDFLDQATLRSAKLLLIPAMGMHAFSRALQAFAQELPIVVCESAEELKELCLASNAGLFYANLDELQECLDLLLSNAPVREAMGANGKKFIAEQVAHGGGSL